MAPYITIVVPTRNRSSLLTRLLASLSDLAYSEWEVIVVDDGSVDTTASTAKHFRDAGLPLRYLYQPWGKMGAARNRGVDNARGEIVAFTDDDCTVTTQWLAAIAA